MAFSRKNFFKNTLLGLGGLAIPQNFEGLVSNSPKRIIKPNRLPKNARLGLIAPASPIYNPSDFDVMIESLTDLGYELVLGDHVKDRNGYLAGADTDRVSDLHMMFSGQEIDGILCTRGGYGSNRILDLVDFDLIEKNPKPFIGFSDITSLHMAIFKKTGLVTFHGPVGKSYWNSFTVDAWSGVLHNGQSSLFTIPEDQDDAFTINSGTAHGHLLGGNLTVLTSLIGSDYLPDFSGSILFLEDIGEDVYRVDRMFSQLKLSGILDQISGLAFGKCTDCSAGGNSLNLDEVLKNYLNPLKIPAFYGAMISHEEQNITLPVGVQAEINADKKTIQLLESGTL